MAGLEVEAIEEHGRFEHVVAGRIIGLEVHPASERLAVCVVDAGSAGSLRIVSGAPNLEAGLRVPVAMPGARLADGKAVEAIDVRGVRSEAVMASEREIGVSEDGSGVMRLPDSAAPGTALADVYGTADTILDVSITPNRGDCLSILGVAREVSALTGERLRMRPPKLAEKTPSSADSVRVEIRDPEFCPRYVARVVRGLSLAPSPLWMRSRLEALGVRAINNLVDVTNYVMLERGQPLHAFDLARVGGRTIVVRRAGEAQPFVALDGAERRLEPDDLVIADAERVLALAGIMGGAESGVEESTRDVLLESACFAPPGIRRTSRRLGLRTESSFRFERGVDVEGVAAASDRAVELLAALGKGEIAEGRVDAYPRPWAPLEVLVRSERVNRLLGTAFSVAEIGQSLRRVSASVKTAGRGGTLCRAPSFRSDLTREVDFVEEVARLAGYDRIPPTRPRVRVEAPSGGEARRFARRVRAALAAAGMSEMIPPRFIAEAWNAALPGLAPESSGAVRILNPIRSDAAEMRKSVLPGLLLAAARNRDQGEAWIRAFEVGSVFWTAADGAVVERERVGGVLRGPVPPRGIVREGREESFYDAKGVLEVLLAECRVGGVEWRRDGVPPFLHPGKSAALWQGLALGVVGGLHPRLAQAFDLDGDTWVFELDLERLRERAKGAVAFQPLPRFPAVVRDLAVVADEGVEAGAVLALIAHRPDLLVEDVQLFDVYRGSPLPAGKKSLAYSISYRAADRTLTDDEVNQLHGRLVETVTRELGVEQRK